jgi:hypothetical protein
MRELRETNYQRRYDFVMDSSAAEQAFGLVPTPWDTVLRAVLAPSLNAGDARAAQLMLRGEH